MGKDGEEFFFVRVAYMQVLQLAYAQPRKLVFSNKEEFRLYMSLICKLLNLHMRNHVHSYFLIKNILTCSVAF
jgi:hypothetical protein